MKRIPTRELLDTDSGTPAEIAASLADLRRVNRWFGGVSTTQWMIELVSEAIGKSSLSLLEVAAGSGDVPRGPGGADVSGEPVLCNAACRASNADARYPHNPVHPHASPSRFTGPGVASYAERRGSTIAGERTNGQAFASACKSSVLGRFLRRRVPRRLLRARRQSPCSARPTCRRCTWRSPAGARSRVAGALRDFGRIEPSGCAREMPAWRRS